MSDNNVMGVTLGGAQTFGRHILWNTLRILMLMLTFPRMCRLLVSASQDGKLIIWDSYTTNKVRAEETMIHSEFVPI